MGIIKRQGFYYSLISYTGVAIGTVNTLFLYIRIFQSSQIGEWNNIQSLGLIFTQLAQIGLPSIIAKFFPRFRTQDKKHQGLLVWVLIIGGLSFLTVSGLFLIFKNSLLHYYTRSPYFKNIIYLIIPYSFFLLSNAIFDVLSRVIYKGLLFSFMNEVVVRLGTSIAIILYYFKFIDFYQFLLIFIGLTGSITIALAIQLKLSGEFTPAFRPEFFKTQSASLLQYGFYTFLGGSTFLLVQKLDTVILTHYKGDSVQGVYSIFLYIIAVIRIPSIAIARVSYQLVSDFWQNQDLSKIEEIYKKTSLVQMILGTFLFLGIALNRDFLVFVLKKPAYQDSFSIFYILCMAVLIDTTTGLNTYILAISNKFRISTGILLVSVAICWLSNNLLIPNLGAMGAALSLLITYAFMNFCNTLYLHIRFDLQPFSWSHLKVFGIAIFTYVLIYYLPVFSNHFYNLALHSLSVCLIFGMLIIFLNVSQDINEQVIKFAKRFNFLSK